MIDFLTENLSKLFFWKTIPPDASDLVSNHFDALAELDRRRQQDPSVQLRIEKFLRGDIPEYFKNGPILYLARHINTPNFETIRFMYLMKHLGMNAVVSHDSRGKFAPHNHIKRALGKLHVCTRLSQENGSLHEHYQNFTIIDFNSAAGKPFSDITTVWGEGLIDFHTRLFTELGLDHVESPDDAAWIDRHHRTNLLEHYKELLSLFVVHGIFFENYNMEDKQERLFVQRILRPACEWVEKEFGYKPLIVPIFPTTLESCQFWISYPKKVGEILRRGMDSEHLHLH